MTRLSIRAGEIGGGIIFAVVVVAPLLAVFGIALAYQAFIPQLVQH